MNDMMDRDLVEWLRDGPERGTDTARERAFAAVRATSQRPTWLATMTGGGVSTSRATYAPRRIVLVFIVLALALAGTIALAVAGGMLKYPSREDGPLDPVIANPEPPRITQPTLSVTSLGTIEWTKVTTDARISPVDELDGQILGYDYEGDTWWSSQDAITWTREPAPELNSATYVQAGSTTLAMSSPDGYSVQMGPISYRQVLSRNWYDYRGDAAIYRRDASTWIQLAIPSNEPAAIPGVTIHSPRFSGAAALDESNWIVPTLRFVEIPWAEILDTPPTASPSPDGLTEPLPVEPGQGPPDSDALPIWNEQTQRLDIFPSGNFDSPVVSLKVTLVDGDPPTIEFRNVDGGKLIHKVPATLPGWSAEALMAALRGWGLDDIAFVVARRGEISVVRPPWPMGEEWADQAIVTAFGKYYTISLPLAPGYAAAGVHLWESEDGAKWAELELPDLDVETLERADLTGGPNQLIMTARGMGQGSEVVWTSSNGRDWTQAAVDASDVIAPVSTTFGWLMDGGYGTFDRAIISADGRDWETVKLPPLPGEPSMQYFNGLMIFGPEQGSDGKFVSWVGRLVD